MRQPLDGQTLLTGVLTERDVFRSVMRKIGARGGQAGTPAQQAVRRRNIKKAMAVRRANLAAGRPKGRNP